MKHNVVVGLVIVHFDTADIKRYTILRFDLLAHCLFNDDMLTVDLFTRTLLLSHHGPLQIVSTSSED